MHDSNPVLELRELPQEAGHQLAYDNCSTVSSVRWLLNEDNGGWLLSIVDWLKLDTKTAGSRLNGLKVKGSRETEGPYFETSMKDSGWTLLRENSENEIIKIMIELYYLL